MLCLDTYALVEILEGNERYASISQEEFVVPDCNLGELHYVLHRRNNERTARYWVDRFRSHVRSVDLDTWVEAARYRAVNHAKNLSFFDCLGYAFSQRNGCIFVTGDKAFEKEKGVRYIK